MHRIDASCRRPPPMEGVAALAAVLPVLAVRLGRTAVHLARFETAMIRATAEAIVWGPELGRCAPRCCEEWRISCHPPCYGCRCHG